MSGGVPAGSPSDRTAGPAPARGAGPTGRTNLGDGMPNPPVRVLVCDDQALIRTGFATIIDAQPDLEVVGECADGRAAVDHARRLEPDVVVMDVRMPVLDGIEATRLLAGAGVERPVKVLVVTTFNLDEYVYEALRAGASGFLLKDAPAGQLLAGIRTVASGAALLAPEVTRQLVGRYAARIRPAESAPSDTALTPRELEVLRLIADGRSNSEIAATLVISQETVKTYVSRILAKLNLRDRVQAVVHAYRTGLVT
ncbi:response regulator transcription factor [Promicromonospora sukumoe]